MNGRVRYRAGWFYKVNSGLLNLPPFTTRAFMRIGLHRTLMLLLVGMTACKMDRRVELSLEKNPTSATLFADGIVSTALYERDIAVSVNGHEIIYTLGDYRQTHRSLVTMGKDEAGWQPAKILPFSGEYNDIEPFLAADDSRLYFASDRPVDSDTTRVDYNIWVVERSGSAWAIPRPLDTLINTRADEFFPSVARNGNLYFTASRANGIGREDIYISIHSEGKYKAPQVLDSMVNTAAYEFNAYVSPEEDLLIFSSYGREDDLGGGDLYISRKDDDGHWSPSTNMGVGINSAFLDFCPFIDFPRGNFYFTSERRPTGRKKITSVPAISREANLTLNGMGNIYRVALDSLAAD